MKCIAIAAVLVTVCSFAAQSQLLSYDAGAIPDSIKKNASVVVRSEKYYFEVTDIDRAYLKHRKIITVLGKEGKSALNFYEQTNKFYQLDDVDIKVYDAAGKVIAKYRKKDLNSSAYGEGLVDDGKVYYLGISTASYPVTLDVEYSSVYKGTLFYPSYYMQSSGEGIMETEYTAKVPKELDLRWQARNVNIAPVVTEEGKYKLYTWKASNVPPIHFEEGSLVGKSYPHVILAPNKFKLDNYEGDMSSWNSFGYWYSKLAKGTESLPEDRKEFFRDLVKDAPNEKEKVRLIYSYLQNNFRYVSIQLGIGGFKPFPADFTDKKKYGDCKGLSNYTQAALSAVGVKSYQALIYRDNYAEKAETGFTVNHFNHVILLVPVNKDSLWLECTSKTLDFATLDNSTLDRKALVITETGGQLVATPLSKPSDNTFRTSVSVKLEADGYAVTESRINTQGEYRSWMYELRNEKRDDLKQYLVQYWGLKQPDDFEMKYEGEGSLFQSMLKMEVEKLPEFIAGSKMFLAPRLHKLWFSTLPAATARTSDFYFPHPFDKSDTTTIVLPAGYKDDALPASRNLDCGYASYSTKYWFDAEKNAIISSARLVLKKTRVSAKDYMAVKTFFDEVVMDDAQRIVIKKS